MLNTATVMNDMEPMNEDRLTFVDRSPFRKGLRRVGRCGWGIFMRMQCLYEGDFWGEDLGDMDGVCGDWSAYVASLHPTSDVLG